MNITKKDCANCHFSYVTGEQTPCFTDGNCFANRKHPKWAPMWNGDKVRHMSNRELADLWGSTVFETQYMPETCTGPDCKWPNFSCECCPETFLSWLNSEVDDEH